VVVAGGALGAAGHHLERAYGIRPPQTTETATGWHIAGLHGRPFSGLALHGTRLLWHNGPSIEYFDLGSGKLRLLGPGPGMRATWAPAVGSRYAVWFEAERSNSLAAQAVAYDVERGRRWTLAEIGAVYSLPAVSGGDAVWCSATELTVPRVAGAHIADGTALAIADEYGIPAIADGLVVWARSAGGPFAAHELSSSRTWPVVVQGLGGRMTRFALGARTLVWGQLDSGGSGAVLSAGVDGGETRQLATGVIGLAGPAFDGTTVVWAERDAGTGGSRVMGRRLGGGDAFLIAAADGEVAEVAVSGGVVAWIAGDGVTSWIDTAGLPR
jgi:hypothetical protein